MLRWRPAAARRALPLLAWAAAPLAVLNLSVAVVGHCAVFPLSPLHVGAKLQALGRYLAHRPRCLWGGHPDPGVYISSTERRYHLPSGLLRTLLEVESDLQPHRISPSGAMGIAQLLPSTARLLGVQDPFDTEAGVDAGGRYLAEQLATFRSIPLAVAAYNAGPGNVVGRVPANGETERYVARVMDGYRRLRAPGPRPRGPARPRRGWPRAPRP